MTLHKKDKQDVQAFDISNHGVLVERTINEHRACRKNKIHMMKLQSILLIFTQFTLPETNIFAPENADGWNSSFLLLIFKGV